MDTPCWVLTIKINVSTNDDDNAHDSSNNNNKNDIDLKTMKNTMFNASAEVKHNSYWFLLIANIRFFFSF